MSLHEYLRFDPECAHLAEGAVHATAPLADDPDPTPVLASLDGWAYELAGRMPLPWNLHEALDVLNFFMFKELGFRGDRETYDDPRNAVLPAVMNRRSGIPISLSIVWMDLSRRLGLDAVGIPLPGHFVVGIRLDVGMLYFDPFFGGRPIEEEEASRLVRRSTHGKVTFQPEMLLPASHRAILHRLVRNLYVRFTDMRNWQDALWAATHMVLLSPENARPYRDRAFVRVQRGEHQEAVNDLKEAIRLSPPGNAELEGLLARLEQGTGEKHGLEPFS